MIKKSSVEWLKELYPDIEVIDPDGWDREHFRYSWNEKISKDEFNNRLVVSTLCSTKPDKLNNTKK